ncbi:MAG: putative transport system permease protein, partial [Acidimicrobiaceae bacterium]|nr:putative transport system permease protein [Acidimicrobiaceae bacterium]
KTGDNSIQTFLVDTKGASPAAVAAALRTSIGPAAQISDIASTRRIVGSSLTAVDLRGLTKVELAFALTMAGAAVVLALATGMQQRRRTLDITRALGARPGQGAAAIRSEVAVVGLSGVLTGAILGTGMAFVLTKVLTGVFDPPPDRLSVPWAYLATLASALVAMALLTSMATLRAARRPIASSLRAT